MASQGSNTAKPLVAVSACLLGERVRYDGDHKRDPYIVETLSAIFELKPVCPEVGIGMGIPRPPIQLVSDGGLPRALGVKDANVDVTDALTAYARQLKQPLQAVSGYIFKSRSPSCGLTDARLFDSQGVETGLATGVHARVVLDLFKNLPVADEQQLQDPDVREQFLRQVFCYWREHVSAEH